MNPDETDMAAEPDKDLSVDDLEGVAGGRGTAPARSGAPGADHRPSNADL